MSFIDRAAVAEVAASLTDIHKRALAELCSDYGRGPRHLSSNLGISLSDAREILSFFKSEGICAFGSLWNEDDGLCSGRGYWLDRFGLAVREEVLPEFAA